MLLVLVECCIFISYVSLFFGTSVAGVAIDLSVVTLQRMYYNERVLCCAACCKRVVVCVML